MSPGLRRARLGTAGLLLGSLALSVALAELALRFLGYRYSPIVFVRPEGPNDHRPFHMGTESPRLDPRNPLTVPDPDLLWRPDPNASPELTAEGFRGDPVPLARSRNDLLIVAVGDSNTLGPLDSAEHWPGILQDLLRDNASARSFQVLNAGVYGFTSFQGLRRFRQLLPYRPDLAYFSFGGNDPQPVRTSDERYAARVAAARRLGDFRLGPPLLNLFWRTGELLGGDRSGTQRVSLTDYRRNLQAFVNEARGNDIVPVLMTRPFLGLSDDRTSWHYYAPAYNDVVRAVAAESGAACFDAHRLVADRPERFLDAMHLDRVGLRALAEGLLSQLHELGFVDSDQGRDLASGLDLASADERRLELGPGFWRREPRNQGPGGRWTGPEASLLLERNHGERGLLVDLSCLNPRGRTRGRIERLGRTLTELPEQNGRHRMRLRLDDAVPRVDLRFLVDSAFRPRDLDGSVEDDRLLGVFLHEVRLLPDVWPEALDMGTVEDGHAALVSGVSTLETWSEGAGRWLSGSAVMRMGSAEESKLLLLDVRFQHPAGRTQGTVTVDGRPVGRFDAPNERRLLAFDVAGPAGKSLDIGIQVEHPFRPRERDPRSSDGRTLGAILHGAWLAARAPLEKPDPPPRVGPTTTLWLLRNSGERRLEVDLGLEAALTSARFEINGELAHAFRRGPGRILIVLDVSRFAGRVLALRVVVDFPCGPVPGGQELVVHSVALRP